MFYAKNIIPLVKVQILLLISTFLSGCITPHYQPPSDGPTANVKFMPVQGIDQYTLYILTRKEDSKKECYNESVANGLMGGHQAYVDIKVPGDQEFIARIKSSQDVGVSMTNICDMTFSFIPQANHYYEVAYSIYSDIGECSVEVSEVEDGLHTKTVPIRKINIKSDGDSIYDTSICVK